jgi:hypothetical protein
MEDEITITLKILHAPEQVSLTIPRDLTIDALKELAADYTTYPKDRVRLLFRGHALIDNETLSSSNITDHDCIRVVPSRPNARVFRPVFQLQNHESIGRLRHQILQTVAQFESLRRAAAQLREEVRTRGPNGGESLARFQGLVTQLLPEFTNFRTAIRDARFVNVNGQLMVEGRPQEEPRPERPAAAERPPLVMPDDVMLSPEERAIVLRDIEAMAAGDVRVTVDPAYHLGNPVEDLPV